MCITSPVTTPTVTTPPVTTPTVTTPPVQYTSCAVHRSERETWSYYFHCRPEEEYGCRSRLCLRAIS